MKSALLGYFDEALWLDVAELTLPDKAELGFCVEAGLDRSLLDWVEVVAEVAVEDKAPFEEGVLELICDADSAEQPANIKQKSNAIILKTTLFIPFAPLFKIGGEGFAGRAATANSGGAVVGDYVEALDKLHTILIIVARAA